MDNNFADLINETLSAIDSDTNSEFTQLKVKTILDFINDLNDLPSHIYFIVLFLLAVSTYCLQSTLADLYLKVNNKIINFLMNYNYFPLCASDVKEYYDSNLANAILPLTELSANVHKSGDIVHFIEHKYQDATGRKFVSISVPNYDERQSILQFRLSEQLKSE